MTTAARTTLHDVCFCLARSGFPFDWTTEEGEPLPPETLVRPLAQCHRQLDLERGIDVDPVLYYERTIRAAQAFKTPTKRSWLEVTR